MEQQIRFPSLGITLKNIGDGFTIAGFEIKYYGIVIAIGFFLGLMMAYYAAKRTKDLDPELVFDYMICMIIPAIIGARLYYVIFSWDYYKNNLGEILKIRSGGLAIYGGIFAAVLTLIVFCRVKNISMMKFGDVAIKGLLIGQIAGRWGNFFNREAFGSFTDGLFAMQIPTDYFLKQGRLSEIIESGVYDHSVMITVGNKIETFIQVHPTFLYESLWNLAVLIFILWFTKRKKFDGELVALYAVGYGIGRFWIEGLRTDSLMIAHTGIRVSQLVAAVLVLAGLLRIIFARYKIKKDQGIELIK